MGSVFDELITVQTQVLKMFSLKKERHFWVGWIVRFSKYFIIFLLLLGRGPFLKIDATNISRKHVRVNISREGDVQLTCLHKNCIFVKQKSKDDSWRDLDEGKTVSLENGDEFKFLTNNFHFQISQSGALSEKSVRVDKREKVSEEDFKSEQNAVEKDVRFIEKSKPTSTDERDQIGSKTPNSDKKKQLPGWMIAAGSSGLSLNKEKPLLEEESYYSKSKIGPSKEKSDSEEESTSEYTHCVNKISEKVKENGSSTNIKNILKNSFINDEEESDKEMSEEDIDREAESMNLLAEIAEEPSKSKAGESSKQQVSDEDDDKENRSVTVRRSCPFGGNCYRKNPLHRRDEAHPGDGDYKDPDENIDNEEDAEKPECEYGINCYRKNPQHRKDFQHTKRPHRKRAAADKLEKKRKKKKTDDDYDSDDSFIDDDEDGWEPVDDSDEDADFEAPADMSSDFE